jgi:hypothetical protein
MEHEERLRAALADRYAVDSEIRSGGDELDLKSVSFWMPENDGADVPCGQAILREVSGKSHRVEVINHSGFLTRDSGTQ